MLFKNRTLFAFMRFSDCIVFAVREDMIVSVLSPRGSFVRRFSLFFPEPPCPAVSNEAPSWFADILKDGNLVILDTETT